MYRWFCKANRALCTVKLFVTHRWPVQANCTSVIYRRAMRPQQRGKSGKEGGGVKECRNQFVNKTQFLYSKTEYLCLLYLKKEGKKNTKDGGQFLMIPSALCKQKINTSVIFHNFWAAKNTSQLRWASQSLCGTFIKASDKSFDLCLFREVVRYWAWSSYVGPNKPREKVEMLNGKKIINKISLKTGIYYILMYENLFITWHLTIALG